MKPKYSTKKSLLFRVTPTLKRCLTQFLTYLYVPDSGSPLPGTVPPPPVVWVGRWVGGEVEHEVEGISEKWWMLAPDE